MSTPFKMKGMSFKSSPARKSYRQAYADSASAQKKYKTLADFTAAAKGYHKKKQTEHVAEGTKKNVSLETKKVSTPKLETQTPSAAGSVPAPAHVPRKRVQKKIEKKTAKVERLETKREKKISKGKSTEQVDNRIAYNRNRLTKLSSRLFKKKK